MHIKLFLKRLTFTKAESRFLSNEIWISSCYKKYFFLLMKKLIPTRVIFVSSSQKVSPGKEMLLIERSYTILRLLKPMTRKLNFIKGIPKKPCFVCKTLSILCCDISN